MIIIANISKEFKQSGEHEYVVKINRKTIAHFKHKREEGLAVCLQKAARAVEKANGEVKL